jgi:hypothetical protein
MLEVVSGRITGHADTPEELAMETLDVIAKIFNDIGHRNPEAAEIYRRRLLFGMIHPRALTCDRAQPDGTVSICVEDPRFGLAVCILERGEEK